MFCHCFPLTEILGWLNNLYITNFLRIYDFLLKKVLTVNIFKLSTFSMVWFLLLLHLMKIHTKTDNFWNKTIVKHFLTAVKYFETTINTKFSMLNHYLTNYNAQT